MFDIDTGAGGGSLGPWVGWTPNGSARKGLSPESWFINSKLDGGGYETCNLVNVFDRGVVMDLDTLKLGWEKDGGAGQGPERRWNPSVNEYQPRPDESKKQSGAFAWSKALSVRLAIGGGAAATWEQAAYGAFRAFEDLAPKISAGYQAGKCPVIRQTGVKHESTKAGPTVIPIFEILSWVDKPDCLKTGIQSGIQTGGAQGGNTPPPPPPPQNQNDEIPF